MRAASGSNMHKTDGGAFVKGQEDSFVDDNAIMALSNGMETFQTGPTKLVHYPILPSIGDDLFM